jgi:threonine synthase
MKRRSYQVTEDRVNGWAGTRTLILIPNADWDRFKQAQQTGAHVIVRATNFDAVIRYVQTVADDLVIDRSLGPCAGWYTPIRPE